MQALEAALAFAITMLVLAMIVTTLVETLHRIFGLREKGLAILLGNFYDRILATRNGGAVLDTDDRRWFVDMMTINRGPVGKAPMTALQRALHLDSRAEDKKFLNWIWSGRRLGSLNLMAFMERLGGSQYGARLVAHGGTAGDKGVEWMLKDVAQKFDAFGAEASQYFESRARLLSVIVGFVLAFAINVNALTLFDTFMKRPDVTQAMIARGQNVTASYEQLATRLDASAKEVGAVGNPGTPAAPANGAEAQQLEETRTAVRQAANEAADAVRDLQSAGVPIGWNAATLAELRRSPSMALLGLLLGGLLIGLGGPFWYKAVQSLTGVRQVARSEQKPEAVAAAAAFPPAAPNQLPGTPIEAFHAALGAMLAAGELRAPEEAVG